MKKILEMKDMFINGFNDIDKIEFIRYNKNYKLNDIDVETLNILLKERIEKLNK